MNPILTGPSRSLAAITAPVFATARRLAHDAIPDTTVDASLNGYCPYTARALTIAFKDTSYPADTIRGAFYDDPSAGPKPTQEADIGDTYDGHWWVEVTIDGVEYTADLCSLLPEREHEPLLMADTPPEYVPLARNPAGMQMFDP